MLKILKLSSIKNVLSIAQRCLATQNCHIFMPTNSPINAWIYKQNTDLISPTVSRNLIKLPNRLTKITPLIPNYIKYEITSPPAPSSNQNIPKQAKKILIIRRKKMKKHKLKKLRKRMKFEWAKLRLRREFKKEKIFRAGLHQLCKEAEAFSVEDYVTNKLNKLHELNAALAETNEPPKKIV